jgi:hypothetical protein
MKITRMAILSCCIAVAVSTSAFAATITSWTFETSLPTTAGPHAAEVGTGSALGFHAAASAYSNPVGNGTAESFSSTAWAVGDYYQFTTSTMGYNSLSFSIDHTSSGTGPRDFKFSVSTDGSTFTDLGTYSVLANAAPNSWTSGTYLANGTFTTALPVSLNNQSSIYVRVVQANTTSANGGTVASGGTSRVDTVVVSGTLVPEPSSFALAFLSVGVMLFRRK